MKKSNSLSQPFMKGGAHRLFFVIAGTLVSVMAVTQASAMLPTPEPVIDNTAVQALNSNAQAVATKITASLLSVDANGREQLVPVTSSTRLQSGNIIEYQGLFTNTNPDRVRKMTVTMSIPDQVELLGGVSPDYAFASADSATFARMPLRGQVNGQAQEIPLQYYQALRWDLEGVGLNETVAVKYRARVK